MDPATSSVTRKAMLGLVQLVVVLGVAIFLPAGTASFVEGWVLLGLFGGASLAVTLYLARKDPALLARRTQAGPVAEKERSQKIIQALASLTFVATLVVPALDHRLGGRGFRWRGSWPGTCWSRSGFSWCSGCSGRTPSTSGVIEVADEQRVVDTGPYARVRHPMYVGGLVLVAGLPLALGSLVGLATLLPFTAVLVWRLLDEERFLASHLPGYADYCKKTRYRLVPGVW